MVASDFGNSARRLDGWGLLHWDGMPFFGGGGQLLGAFCGVGQKKDDSAFFFKPMGIYTRAWSFISGLYDFPFLFCFIHSFFLIFDIYYLFDIFTIIHTCNYCG